MPKQARYQVVKNRGYFLRQHLYLTVKFIFLDEPTSALDPVSKKKIMNYFLNQSESTVVSVTHDDEWIKSSQVVINMNEYGLDKT